MIARFVLGPCFLANWVLSHLVRSSFFFPPSFQLMEVLDEPRYEHIVSWIDDGKAFCIHQPSKFEQKILPRHFNKASKFSSFSRKLNRWGFVRHNVAGASGGSSAHSHPLFCRDGHKRLLQMSPKSAAGASASSKKAAPRSSNGDNTSAETTNPSSAASNDIMARGRGGEAASSKFSDYYSKTRAALEEGVSPVPGVPLEAESVIRDGNQATLLSILSACDQAAKNQIAEQEQRKRAAQTSTASPALALQQLLLLQQQAALSPMIARGTHGQDAQQLLRLQLQLNAATAQQLGGTTILPTSTNPQSVEAQLRGMVQQEAMRHQQQQALLHSLVGSSANPSIVSSVYGNQSSAANLSLLELSSMLQPHPAQTPAPSGDTKSGKMPPPSSS